MPKYCLIPLGLKGKEFAKVDKSDYEAVSKLKWRKSSRYAISGGVTGFIYMHHLVMGKQMLDHINGDGLDNRKSNLRPCNNAQNAANSGIYSHNKTGYRGVSNLKLNGRYRAGIVINGKYKHLGYHATAEEAALAYNKEAKKQFGEFAYQNTLTIINSIFKE